MIKYDVGFRVYKLHCTRCGHDFTHEISMESWFREEDAEDGLVTIATKDGIASGCAPMTNNPSERRSGFVLSFDCENCGSVSELRIVQHKGQVFLYTAEQGSERQV